MKTLHLVTLAVLAGLLILGCSDSADNPVEPGSNAVEQKQAPREVVELVKQYSTGETLPPDVSLTNRSEFPPDPSDTSYDVYAVTFIWGTIHNSALHSTAPTDWTGEISTNAAAFLDPIYTIDFEPGEDTLYPRNAPVGANWQSFTLNDFDGLSFLLYHERGVVYIAPPKLLFDTQPIRLELSLHELEDFFAFYMVDGSNALAVRARLIPRSDCRKGLFAGEWVKDSTDRRQGHFSAVWFESNFQPSGYLSGTFWMNDDGRGGFAGSLSGYVTDEVIATVSGTWFFDDPSMCPACGEGRGRLEGEFTMLDGSGTGSMEGVFGAIGIDMFETDLALTGQWRLNCPEKEVKEITAEGQQL